MPTNNFSDWLKDLTPEERATLSAYKDESENLKAFLTDKQQTLSLSSTEWMWTSEHVSVIDSAIAKLVHRAPATLWCAVADGRQVRDAIRCGVYHFVPFISTSITETAAYRFFSGPVIEAPVLLQFVMATDFVAAQLPLSEGAGDGENERLLPRNTGYKVLDQSRTFPLRNANPAYRGGDQHITVMQLRPI